MSAPEHPGPWRWIDRAGATLVAADHREWNEEDDGHDSIVLSDRLMCIPGEMSPVVRELVRAAPEMEALLREEVAKDFDRVHGRDSGYCDRELLEDSMARMPRDSFGPVPWKSHCGTTCRPCRLRELLARIDAQKAGG